MEHVVLISLNETDPPNNPLNVKLVTIVENRKKFYVEKLDDLDIETVNAMTTEDFLKFCDDKHVEPN